MAKIVPSTLAPSKQFRITFASASFALDGAKKSAYETDDPAVIAEARAHPWLEVQTAKSDLVTGEVKTWIDPKTDPLSAQHPDARKALDPKAAREALAKGLAVPHVAINAGLDQDEVVTSGPVAETVAAADKAEKAADKTSKEKK
jgi:hypothetical protein